MASISGGQKLQRALAEIGAKIKKSGGVKVGFLRGSTYPNGTPVAMVAAIQNYGAPRAGIPPRPFFTNAIVKYSPQWPNAIVKILKANDYDTSVVMKLMGEGIVGQIQQSIKDTNAPSLAESTLRHRMKGMSAKQIAAADKRAAKTGAPPSYAKPLIDTGHLWNSVKYEVLD